MFTNPCVSCVTYHVSCVTYHMSLTSGFHVSNVKKYIYIFKKKKKVIQFGGASRRRRLVVLQRSFCLCHYYHKFHCPCHNHYHCIVTVTFTITIRKIEYHLLGIFLQQSFLVGVVLLPCPLVILYYCINVLLYLCITVFLYYCITVLLYLTVECRLLPPSSCTPTCLITRLDRV